MGHLPDAAYIGAVAIGATLFSAMFWLLGFLRMGTTGLVAQEVGRNAIAEVARIACRAAIAAVVLGLAIVLLQWPIHAALIQLFNPDNQATELASVYFYTRVWGAPGMLLQFVVLGVLFGLQQMRAALAVSLIVNLTNVVLDLWFVIGLDLDVFGVGLATAISEWLGAFVGVALVVNRLLLFGATRRDLNWPALTERVALTRLFDVGGHLIVRSFFVQLPFFSFTAIGSRFGDLTLAANAVLMQYFTALAYGLDGFAHCAETLTGYAFGAGDRNGMRNALKYSTIWAAGLAGLISLGYGLGAPTLIALLTNQEDVQQQASVYMPWVIAAPLVGVWAFLMDGVYIGTTQARALRNHMLLAATVFGIACVVFIPVLGNHGLWLAMTLFMACRGITLFRAYPTIEKLAGSSGLSAPVRQNP